MSETASNKRYRPETKLVHAGALRSQFGETSEALFLTQGFIYETAEQCEARFKGEDPGFLYSRFSNPNISMFERRMIELEGAEAARATATGMAAVTTAILGGRPAMISAAIEMAVSSGVRAPRSSPIGLDSRFSSSSVTPASRRRVSRSSWVRRDPIAPT